MTNMQDFKDWSDSVDERKSDSENGHTAKKHDSKKDLEYKYILQNTHRDDSEKTKNSNTLFAGGVVAGFIGLAVNGFVGLIAGVIFGCIVTALILAARESF